MSDTTEQRIAALVVALHTARDTDPFDIHRFDAILADLLALQTPEIIQPLLAVFRDDADHHAMYSVLHTVESFDIDDYIPALAGGLDTLLTASREWSALLVLRILNDDHYRDRFTSEMKRRSNVALRKITDIIRRDAPDTGPWIDRLWQTLDAAT